MKTNLKQFLQYLKSENPTTDKDDEIDPQDFLNPLLKITDIAAHEDVMLEILLRLPVRSLVRSKCVSKQWQFLISDPCFSLMKNPNPNPPSGLFLQRIQDKRLPEYEFVPLDRDLHVKPPFKTLDFDPYKPSGYSVCTSFDGTDSGIMVLHSMNGLMLCYRKQEKFCDFREILYTATYYVYNPTVNEFIALPEPNPDVSESCDWNLRRPRGMTLVFNPARSPHYRIVCVQGHAVFEHLYTIEVYSSENRMWRMFGKPFGNQVDTEFTGGVYWNNAVHWVSRKGFVFFMKFDEERVDQIPTPAIHHSWNVKKHCYPIVESRNRDTLLFLDIFPPSSMKLDIHEMERDYSGWEQKYHVDLDAAVLMFPQTDQMLREFSLAEVLQRFMIHCFVGGEKEEDMFIVVEVLGKAIRCNVVQGTFEVICDLNATKPCRLAVAHDGFSKIGRWPGAFLFYESLSKV